MNERQKLPCLTTNTMRQYLAAQDAFRVWCKERRVGAVAPAVETIAAYLESVARERGNSVVPQHLAAIGRMLRQSGRSLDTKSPAIAKVMFRARRALERDRATSHLSPTQPPAQSSGGPRPKCKVPFRSNRALPVVASAASLRTS